MDIRIVSKAIEDGQAVEVNGTIDVYTSPIFKRTLKELLDQGHYRLHIDLEGVRDIDSTGLGVLIGVLKRTRENQGRLVLYPGPLVRKIFALTGMIKVFEFGELPAPSV